MIVVTTTNGSPEAKQDFHDVRQLDLMMGPARPLRTDAAVPGVRMKMGPALFGARPHPIILTVWVYIPIPVKPFSTGKQQLVV